MLPESGSGGLRALLWSSGDENEGDGPHDQRAELPCRLCGSHNRSAIHGPGFEINSNSFSDRWIGFLLRGSRERSTLLVTELFCD